MRNDAQILRAFHVFEGSGSTERKLDVEAKTKGKARQADLEASRKQKSEMASRNSLDCVSP